jgi:alkanesulfonate monooxygenase SsuD/methylene tetrahydromethanopterin reductase-like flavin-dependent oxidoreductase (luciferase family)
VEAATSARRRACPGFLYESRIPGIGAFISPGKSLDGALERLKLADGLGFDSAYVTHIAGRDSLTTLAAYASVSDRIRLGTGVVPIFSRTAATMAQTAATIDEFSGGRMVLGLGVSHRVTVENWHGQTIDKPVTQMREYTRAVRAIFRGEAPPESEYFPTKFQFMGYSARPELPIYIAALSDNMLRLAGEIADGVMLWLCCPSYIRDTVIPAVREGLEAAGRPEAEFDVVAAVPIALTEDPDAARATFRQDLIPYASLPFYRAMLATSGFGEELAAFDAGMAEGDVERAKAGLSDRMLDEIAGIGSKADVHAAVRRYQEAGVRSPCVGGIRQTDYSAGLEAVAELI